MAKEYKTLTIHEDIENKINTLNKTRNNRIEMSLRFGNYNDKWKSIFFFLNIEAVIFILLSLSGDQINSNFENTIFTVFSGIFSIYVILLQYYINEVNYNGRSLKMHYHQLDIEDLILRLKSLIMKDNIEENEIDKNILLKDFNTIMYQYQSILKNNENHYPIDNKNSIFNNQTKKDLNKADVIKETTQEKEMKGKEKSNVKRKNSETPLKEPLDFTIDNIILNLNIIVIFVPFVFIIYTALKGT